MKLIKVMVVDDSRQFASAVAQFLAREGRFDVLASAHSGGEALARAPIERPDLMLIDMSMPGINGLAVATRLNALEVPPKIVMMTLGDGEAYRSGAFAAGADAFLAKKDFARDLPEIVDALFPHSGARPSASSAE
ncbi:MAG TPA: response regulator [Burkholderiales bacterium]|nr:response regulator [Burkholderiales bacterium]